MTAFAIDSEVRGCHIYKDAWSDSELPCMLSKICNREDRYSITHACSNTLKSSHNAVNFCYGN